MHYSVFDLFKIGPGPSSSHTIGPIKAANHLLTQIKLPDITSVKVHLYGSLALTGKGHGTDEAAIIGLCGYTPDKISRTIKESVIHSIYKTNTINLGGIKAVPFNPSTDIIYHFDEQLPLHPNGISFLVRSTQSNKTSRHTYYSPGGGFINNNKGEDLTIRSSEPPPHPFKNASELMQLCNKHNVSIAELMLANETTWMPEEHVYANLKEIWETMNKSIESGLSISGILPGGLNVKRRAPELYNKLTAKINRSASDILDWLSVYAMAVNEENATGGCIVTAPTNGAAGIIPAVMKYHLEHGDFTEQSIYNYLLTAGAIGILYKQGASLSAAEVGCQGEVGVACSMAAGGLTAISGGTIDQIENAAEIGMEHNLGLTCDPIGGLVQIPCIERNTMGAVKAVNAAHLALNSDGKHVVSLDKVIATMLKTGKDMQQQYKETSQGGLAIEVNMPEC